MRVEKELGLSTPQPVEPQVSKNQAVAEQKVEQKIVVKEEKKTQQDKIDAILNPDNNKPVTGVKKPRAFVAEADLFDFSDVKIITGTEGEIVPTAIEEKASDKMQIKKISPSTTSEKKA